MARFRTAWTVGVVVFGSVGTWAALDLLGAGGVLTILVLAACVGVSVALVPMADGSARPWRQALRVGAVTGGVAVAAAGLTGMFGPVGAALAVTLVVLSPSFLTQGLRRLRRSALDLVDRGAVPDSPSGLQVPLSAPRGDGLGYGTGPPVVPVALPFSDPTGLADDPASMDDAALCLAWGRTYVALQRKPDLALEIAQRRALLLDELERRNARGFRAWLEAGAGAAGDPSRFILTNGRHDHPG